MNARVCSFFTNCVAVALLAGCGSLATPQSTAPMRDAAGARPNTANTGWLYLAEDQYNVGIVYVFGYPDENRVQAKAIANLGNVYGPCVDAKGNVWIPALKHNAAHVYEFAAGKTKMIGRLDVPGSNHIGECAVDPANNDLAVIGTNSVNIFTNAQGKPANHALKGSNDIAGCTYDGGGNLFVDAMKQISSSFTAFTLYELPKGANTFETVKLDKRTGFAGGIEWDGQYLAVVTGGNGLKPVLYRFTVSGTTGTVAQSLHLNGLSYDAWFATGDGRIVATSGLYGTKTRFWPYPQGGGWTSELSSSNVAGLAIAPL